MRRVLAVRATPGRNKFLIDVNISKQNIYVYRNGSKIKTLSCSTGFRCNYTKVKD